MTPVILIMTKSPIPGEAKTRLSPQLSPHQAAALAAAALLDTLEVASSLSEVQVVVALAGSPADAIGSRALRGALSRCLVIPQSGVDFTERLVNAHRDAAFIGSPVVQIGMDTPQVTPTLLRAAISAVTAPGTAALGPTADGGWWCLAVGDPSGAAALRSVPLSTDHTGRDTVTALLARGLTVTTVPELIDVDTCVEARQVAAMVPFSRFGDLARVLLAGTRSSHTGRSATVNDVDVLERT